MLPRQLMLRGGVRRSAVVPTSNPPRSVSKLDGFIEMINDRARRLGAPIRSKKPETESTR